MLFKECKAFHRRDPKMFIFNKVRLIEVIGLQIRISMLEQEQERITSAIGSSGDERNIGLRQLD